MRLAPLVALVAVVAVPSVARAQSAASADAVAAYEQHAIGVRNLRRGGLDPSVAGDRQKWMYGDGAWDAFQGPDHHPISEEAFYRIVGRDDLLRRYQSKARIKTGVQIGSGALFLGGAIFAAITAVRRSNDYSGPACDTTPCPTPVLPGPSPTWGVAIAGAGVVSLIVSHYLNPTPIDADEADRLAGDYDQSLRSRLGIVETAASP